MASFLLAVIVTIVPWYEEHAAQAAPSRVKVFLAESRDVQIQRECASVLATALAASLAQSKHAVPARSAADADVVVQLKECRTATATRVGGEIGVSAWTGGQGRGVQTRTSMAGQLATVGSVVLVVDDRGKPREFAPDASDLPLPEAASNVTASFVAWLKPGS